MGYKWPPSFSMSTSADCLKVCSVEVRRGPKRNPRLQASEALNSKPCKALPGDSYVFVFLVMTFVLIGGHSVLPKNKLHKSLQVDHKTIPC